MDSQAKRPAETKSFDQVREDDTPWEGDWDVSTDVSPPATGCGRQPERTPEG